MTWKKIFPFLFLAVVLFPSCSSPSPATPPLATLPSEPPATEAPITVPEANSTEEIPVSDKMRVTFLNPGISDPDDPTGGFWLSVSDFMMAAAEDLDIDLEIIYAERDHLLMQEQALEVVSRQYPPDYLLVVNEKLAADKIVQTADEAGVKVFVMLNSFVDDQKAEMGAPREVYKNWIGSLVPDNQAAGYDIARAIIDEALENGRLDENGQLVMVAVAGDHSTPASVERVAGLETAVAEYDNVELSQVFVGEWRQDIAHDQIEVALQRYPGLGVVWTANDPMALGAMEAIAAAGLEPGKDIYVGGLNWDPPALEKIKDGSLTMSTGGHFMTGGWSLVLLHDYHHDQDFSSEGVELKQSIFSVVNQQNIDYFLSEFGDRDWGKIDFTKFSKIYNPDLDAYDFSLEAIVSQHS